MSRANTEKEQIKADIQFRKQNVKQRVRSIKAPVVVKAAGERYRVATQTVITEEGVLREKYLVKV